ncbi:MAG: RNA polymerase sigma-70 factor (ECF subfamily) [Halioglobus sp.]
MVTGTTRLCIDYLKSARVQGVPGLGHGCPNLFAPRQRPEAHKERADTLSYAFMMLLERLNPTERAVYILREAFDLRHEAIAEVLGHNCAHSRQLSRRAKEHLGQHVKRFECSDKDQERLFTRFVEASAGGDLQPLFDMLSEDITAYSDGGGKVLAALRPLRAVLQMVSISPTAAYTLGRAAIEHLE